MQYLISFLEGIITFISPCLLPMLPIYISYFAGGDSKGTKKILRNALAFIAGFTLLFILMGALAGSLGQLMNRHQKLVNLLTGGIVIFFGFHFLGVFRLNLFKGNAFKKIESGFFASLLFGIVFAIGWTPCVGAFLGSALMMAANRGSVLQGILMLLFYSMGLGVPFLLSALLIDKLKGTFNWIKSHYKIINMICGAFLVAIGLLMASGYLGKFLNLLG